MTRRNFWTLIVSVSIVLTVVVIAVVAVVFPQQQQKRFQLHLYMVTTSAASLNRIAVQSGIYAKNGIDVQISSFELGTEAFDAFESAPEGELALAVVSDVVAVQKASEHKDFKIFTETAQSDNNYNWVIAKEPGRFKVSDLKGLRIGIAPVDAVTIFGLESLDDYGISASDVTLVPMSVARMPSALAQGEIDAYPSRKPVLPEDLSAVPGGAFLVDDKGAYDWHAVMLAHSSSITSQGAEIERVLQALIETEAFVLANPEQSVTLLAQSLGVPESQIDPNFMDYLGVRLSTSLTRSMLTDRTLLSRLDNIPPQSFFNFPRDLINSSLLSTVDPYAVHLD